MLTSISGIIAKRDRIPLPTGLNIGLTVLKEFFGICEMGL